MKTRLVAHALFACRVETRLDACPGRNGDRAFPPPRRVYPKKTRMKKLAVVLLIPLFSLAQQSDPRIGAILAELASVRPFDQVAISPDGKRVAWIEEIIENRIDTGNSAIYLSAGGPPMLISAKPASSDRNLAWSPDSTRIAFLSDRDKKGQMQLYVAAASGGRPRKLTNLTGYLTDPQWSPDGTRLAVLFAENAPAAKVLSKPSPSKPASSAARSTTSA
jgi:WD40 repeat protein